VGIFYFLQLSLSQTLTNGTHTSQWRRLHSWFIFLLLLGMPCYSTHSSLRSANPDILVIHYVNLSDYCNATSLDGSLTNECHEVEECIIKKG